MHRITRLLAGVLAFILVSITLPLAAQTRVLATGCEIARDLSSVALLALEPQQIDNEMAAKIRAGATAETLKLKDLPNERLLVSVTAVDKDLKVSYLVATASAKNAQYSVKVDYSRFANLCVDNRMTVVGVGFRVEVQVHTRSAGIDLGNLFAVGLAGSTSAASGSLSMSVIGIADKDITVTLPTFTTVSQESVASAIQAMAIVKSKLAEKQEEVVRPHVLAKQIVKDDVAAISNGAFLLN